MASEEPYEDPKYPGMKFLTTELVDEHGKVVGSFPVQAGTTTRHDGQDYEAGSTIRVK